MAFPFRRFFVFNSLWHTLHERPPSCFIKNQDNFQRTLYRAQPSMKMDKFSRSETLLYKEKVVVVAVKDNICIANHCQIKSFTYKA